MSRLAHRTLAVALTAAAVLLLAGTQLVIGAVGYADFQPPAAPPGTTVAAEIDFFNCPNAYNEQTIRMRLFRDPNDPVGTGAEVELSMVDNDVLNYEFVVPSLAPGSYNIELWCNPGWIGFVLSEEGPGNFTILSSPPDTAVAAQPDASTHGPGSVITVAAFLVAGVLAFARPRRRQIRVFRQS